MRPTILSSSTCTLRRGDGCLRPRTAHRCAYPLSAEVTAGHGPRAPRLHRLLRAPRRPVQAELGIRGSSTSESPPPRNPIDMIKVSLDSAARFYGDVASVSDMRRRCGLRISGAEPTSDNDRKPSTVARWADSLGFEEYAVPHGEHPRGVGGLRSVAYLGEQLLAGGARIVELPGGLKVCTDAGAFLFPHIPPHRLPAHPVVCAVSPGRASGSGTSAV